MILESIKLIWARIPKKTLSSTITFVLGYFAKFVLDHYISEQPLSLSKRVIEALIGSAVLLIAYFIASFTYFGLKVISELRDQKNSIPPEAFHVSTSNITQKKKPLPNRFELEILNFSIFEYTVFIRRWWFPIPKAPSVEDFLKAIEFSGVRCGECHSDFYIEQRGLTYFTCTNPDCANKKTYHGLEIHKFFDQAKAKYFGDIRKDFKKYWGSYQHIYLEYSEGKPQDYADP